MESCRLCTRRVLGRAVSLMRSLRCRQIAKCFLNPAGAMAAEPSSANLPSSIKIRFW